MRPQRILLLLVASLFLLTGFGFVVDHGVYQVPSLPRPGLHQPMQDPVFSTTVTRVTDPAMGSTRGYRHEYARLAAFSADNARIVVSARSGGYYYVLALTPGAAPVQIPSIPCGRDPSITWHRHDPDVLIYLCRNEVRTFRVSTRLVTVVARFPQYTRIETREEGTVSDDWTSAAFFATTASGSKEAIVVDLPSQTVIARDPAIAFGDWIGISPSGQYVVIQHGGTTGTRVYDRGLQYLRTLHPDFAHEDFAIDDNGEDVLVWHSKTAGQSKPFGGRSMVAKGRLRDGLITALIDTKWKWTGHLSGVGSRGRPGWILMSDYRAPGGENNSPFQREVFWLKMDGSGEVRRLAHHHSDVAQCGTSKDYWAEPHAVASWDGTRVLFASVWGDSCTRYDAYVIESHGAF